MSGRDQHLPPPAIANWLLDQEWSEVIPLTVTRYPESHPAGISQSVCHESVEARIAIGADEIGRFSIPREALEILAADKQARAEKQANYEAWLRSCERQELSKIKGGMHDRP